VILIGIGCRILLQHTLAV